MGVERISSDGPSEPEVAGRKKGSRKHVTLFIVISVVNVALLVLLATQLLTPAQNKSDIKVDNTNVLGDVTSPLIG
ncbi:MAG: hypothetical protein H0V70_04305, partial [Ktedonobacteraceae bacterium]|nr:hypothetical protein [Ktedonobacteraceae bacterium]